MRAGTDTQEGVKRGHAPLNDWPAGDGAGRGKYADHLCHDEFAAEIGERAPDSEERERDAGNAQCTSLSLSALALPICQGHRPSQPLVHCLWSFQLAGGELFRTAAIQTGHHRRA